MCLCLDGVLQIVEQNYLKINISFQYINLIKLMPLKNLNQLALLKKFLSKTVLKSSHNVTSCKNIYYSFLNKKNSISISTHFC